MNGFIHNGSRIERCRGISIFTSESAEKIQYVNNKFGWLQAKNCWKYFIYFPFKWTFLDLSTLFLQTPLCMNFREEFHVHKLSLGAVNLGNLSIIYPFPNQVCLKIGVWKGRKSCLNVFLYLFDFVTQRTNLRSTSFFQLRCLNLFGSFRFNAFSVS